MKKILLFASITVLVISVVFAWLSSVWTGVIATVLLGALIAFDVFLLRNNPRLWISIIMWIISIFILGWFSFNLALPKETKLDITTEEITEEEFTDIIEEAEEPEKMEIEEEVSNEDDETDEETVTQGDEIEKKSEVIIKEVVKEVPVEKVVVKKVPQEVPVEKEVVKEVVKEVIKEVPKIEYIEVEKEPEPTPQPSTTTPAPTVQPYSPTTVYGYGYGDPTMGGYGYGYGNQYGYGDPTGGYNGYYSTSSIRISGPEKVYAGEEETYTISGVSSISKNKLDLPANVSVEKISGNKVTLSFEEEWTGSYSICYGNASIDVKVYE